MSRDWKAKVKPYEPADYDEDVIYAVRALSAGTALPHQQKVAWDWLMYVTGTGDFQELSFRPGGAEGTRETDFAEGKRFVGLQVLKMLHSMVTPKQPVKR